VLGVEAVGELGAVTITGTAVVYPDGVEGTGEAGYVIVWGDITPDPGTSWSPIDPNTGTVWTPIAA
jgi:hypothetical protein